jgi:hypothetical protein
MRYEMEINNFKYAFVGRIGCDGISIYMDGKYLETINCSDAIRNKDEFIQVIEWDLEANLQDYERGWK